MYNCIFVDVVRRSVGRLVVCLLFLLLFASMNTHINTYIFHIFISTLLFDSHMLFYLLPILQTCHFIKYISNLMWGVNRKLFHVKPVVSVSVLFFFVCCFLFFYFDLMLLFVIVFFFSLCFCMFIVICIILLLVRFFSLPIHYSTGLFLSRSFYFTFPHTNVFIIFWPHFLCVHCWLPEFWLLFVCCSPWTGNSSSFLCSLVME